MTEPDTGTGPATASAPSPSASSGSASGNGGSGSVSYHGQRILKAPVWSGEIPTYLFTGGLAGASGTLAYLAELRGERELSQRAWLAAMAGVAASPPLLIADLGRPERFLNMLRLFKVTSPMSMGSWILSVYGASATLAAANAWLERLPVPPAWGRRLSALGIVARPTAALSGLGLSTYTAALFADTAVPVWHEARQILPFVFGAGAAVSAGGAVTALTPVANAAAARRLALGAARAELAATGLMERSLGLHGETLRHGRAGRMSWLSRGCLTAGSVLLSGPGARRRPAAVAGGALMCAGALATRWAVFEAGRASTADPRYVVEPQLARRDRV